MNLEQLHAARLKGLRPEGDLWVTDNRKVYEYLVKIGAFVLGALPNQDWRPIRGLPVCVVVDDPAITQAIASAKPNVQWCVGYYGFLYRVKYETR